MTEQTIPWIPDGRWHRDDSGKRAIEYRITYPYSGVVRIEFRWTGPIAMKQGMITWPTRRRRKRR